MALIEDLCASLASIGFRRIVFLNGHYDNTYAIAYACANAAERMPAGMHAFPVNYWDGMTAEEAGEFFGPTTGLHANRGETSAVMAIDPDLVDLDAANAELPPFPEVTNQAPVHTAFFFSAPGSVHRATQVGDLGRRPRGVGRVRPALPRGRDRGDGPGARRHRADVRGDAAALTAQAAPRVASPRTTPRRA